MTDSNPKSNRPARTPEEAARAPRKRAYRAPVLVEYGSVAKLTQAGGSTRSDAPGTERRQCL
jgi:hypothetical protein